MITQSVYEAYLGHLLAGRRHACVQIVQNLLDSDIDIKQLYTDLFQRSLYQVGQMWERNQISVAREHLATAITESALNLVYPTLFADSQVGKKAIISCSANEFHQIGGKMVADILEINGWDGYFLGANTPIGELLAFIDEIQPDMVGLSLSIYFNLPALKSTIAAIQAEFSNMDILIGGQAFHWGGLDAIKAYPNVEYLPSLNSLEKLIGSN